MSKSKLRKGRLVDGRSITYLGYCSGTTEALRHVRALLAPSGIKPFIEGSAAYDIAVLDADVDRAQELLRQDPEVMRYRIKLYAA